ncbi:hypothetical protein KY290_007393 [Solanum tuberosum]|uniref:Uncharacterized protein n=1 Tax=Solanum tuberosum TaxID=4113 RepID=A0ABQ7W855_SOLTU|nr:hypothetical protein KY290_007393 [Solanum tuberosum]
MRVRLGTSNGVRVPATSTVAGQLFSISDFPALPIGPNADIRKSNISGPIDKVVRHSLPSDKSYRDFVGSIAPQSELIQYKEAFMVEGVPHVKWSEKEIDIMNRIENLQFVVIDKFTYDMTDIEEVRRIIPQ